MPTSTGWAVWAAIAVGSALGGVLRHALTEAVGRAAGSAGAFPWGTVLVNLLGSVAIGVSVAAVSASWPGPWPPATRHAVITGVLGGFTTFSAFSVQTMALLHQGALAAAAVNVVVSVGLGLAGCWTGYSAVAAVLR